MFFLYFEDAIFPMLCYSHLTKNLKDDINKAYDDHKIRQVISGLVGHTFGLRTIPEIKKHLELVMTLIASPKKTQKFVSKEY